MTTLSPQANIVWRHMNDAGSITQREAIADHSIQSLTRRISEIVAAGIKIEKERKTHPLTGQRYMRYSLTNRL